MSILIVNTTIKLINSLRSKYCHGLKKVLASKYGSQGQALIYSYDHEIQIRETSTIDDEGEELYFLYNNPQSVNIVVNHFSIRYSLARKIFLCYLKSIKCKNFKFSLNTYNIW